MVQSVIFNFYVSNKNLIEELSIEFLNANDTNLRKVSQIISYS